MNIKVSEEGTSELARVAECLRYAGVLKLINERNSIYEPRVYKRAKSGNLFVIALPHIEKDTKDLMDWLEQNGFIEKLTRLKNNHGDYVKAYAILPPTGILSQVWSEQNCQRARTFGISCFSQAKVKDLDTLR